MSSSTPQAKADPPANPIHVSAGETPVPAATAAGTTSPDPATSSSADARDPAAVASPPLPAAPPAAAADVDQLNQPPVGGLEGGVANVNNEDVIEAADDNHSVDSNEFEPEEWDAGSSNASTSISSSVYNHTFENGRRYHSYRHGRYPIPNDDLEQSREDMKHAMMLEMTDGKLFYAPVGDYPQKIIDIGTGTGKKKKNAPAGIPWLLMDPLLTKLSLS